MAGDSYLTTFMISLFVTFSSALSSGSSYFNSKYLFRLENLNYNLRQETIFTLQMESRLKQIFLALIGSHHLDNVSRKKFYSRRDVLYTFLVDTM